jgi:cytochrome c553
MRGGDLVSEPPPFCFPNLGKFVALRLALAVAFAVASTGAEAATLAPPSGAAACSGCHPATRGDFPRLGGRTASDIVAAMKAFRSGERHATVMDRIAKGFNDDEVAAIATWYAAQQ